MVTGNCMCKIVQVNVSLLELRGGGLLTTHEPSSSTAFSPRSAFQGLEVLVCDGCVCVCVCVCVC